MGISKAERYADLSRMTRGPRPWSAVNIVPAHWLPRAQSYPFAEGLLPDGPRPLTPKEVAASNSWFGKDGRFPAVHVPTGEVRGVGDREVLMRVSLVLHS